MTAVDVHVAQINIGTMVAATDDPMRRRVHGQRSSGSTPSPTPRPDSCGGCRPTRGNATEIQIFPDPLTLVNMSVWESVDALKDVRLPQRARRVLPAPGRVVRARRQARRPLARRRPATIPELDEAVRRVEFLERNGPTPYAFGFAKPPVPLVFEATTPDDADTRGADRTPQPRAGGRRHAPGENHFSLDGRRGHRRPRPHDPRPLRRTARSAAARCATSATAPARSSGCSSTRAAEDRRSAPRSSTSSSCTPARLGLTELRLETSAKQPAAIASVRRLRLRAVRRRGASTSTSPETSLCFAKRCSDSELVQRLHEPAAPTARAAAHRRRATATASPGSGVQTVDRSGDADRGHDLTVGAEHRRAHRRHARLALLDALDPAVAAGLRRTATRPADPTSSGNSTPSGHDPSQGVRRLQRQHAAPVVAFAHEQLHALAGLVAQAARRTAAPAPPAGSAPPPSDRATPARGRDRSGPRRHAAAARAPRAPPPAGGRSPAASPVACCSSFSERGASATARSTWTALSSTPTPVTMSIPQEVYLRKWDARCRNPTRTRRR